MPIVPGRHGSPSAMALRKLKPGVASVAAALLLPQQQAPTVGDAQHVPVALA